MYLFRWDFSAVRVGRNSFRITRLATDHCLGHTITVSQSEGYGRHFRYRARVRVRGCSKVRRTGRGGRRPRRFIREKVASAPATFPSSFYPGSKFWRGFGFWNYAAITSQGLPGACVSMNERNFIIRMYYARNFKEFPLTHIVPTVDSIRIHTDAVYVNINKTGC